MPKITKNLWDSTAARKGELVVRNARTGEVVSSKDATQEQLLEYMIIRRMALEAECRRIGLDPNRSHGRRWMARASVREEAIRKKTSGYSRMTLNGWSHVPYGGKEVRNKELFLRPEFLEGRVGPAVGSREVVAEVKAKVAGGVA